ncbi:MAG: chromosome partitioning [Planctomycetota bacterium]|nr:MAG: chromosome partitioning [Planctomycetota bacterium]
MGYVLAIANHKGGVGKTTSAINLGTLFALTGRKTLILDLDLQGNATSGLGVRKEDKPGLASILLDNAPLADVACPCYCDDLFVLPLGRRSSAIEEEIRTQPLLMERLETILDQIAAAWDYVILDCPPAFGILPNTAIRQAQYTCIPVQCEFFSIEGLTAMLKRLQELQASGARSPRTGVVLTMYTATDEHSSQVRAEVERHFSSLLLKSIIPRDPILSQSAGLGIPAVIQAPESLGVRAYLELAWEILNHERQETR